jgi:hypothetical protein
MERDRSIRINKVGQRHYVLDMLERFSMVDYKPMGSPMAVTNFSACVDETSSLQLPFGSVP